MYIPHPSQRIDIANQSAVAIGAQQSGGPFSVGGANTDGMAGTGAGEDAARGSGGTAGATVVYRAIIFLAFVLFFLLATSSSRLSKFKEALYVPTSIQKFTYITALVGLGLGHIVGRTPPKVGRPGQVSHTL